MKTGAMINRTLATLLADDFAADHERATLAAARQYEIERELRASLPPVARYALQCEHAALSALAR